MLAPAVESSLDAPVTAHMRRDFTRLRGNQTVAEALEALRKDPPPERIIYFYVVDDAGKLEGIVPTRYLVLSPADRLIHDIMIRRIVSLPATATIRDACEFFALHRFLAFPVVDAQGKAIGVVDVDLYTSELGQLGDAEKRDDLFQALGVHAAGGEKSASTAFRRRFPWLICNMVGGVACALLGSIFEAELRQVVALALFIPVVLNLAESVSSQSVSLTLHQLRGERASRSLLLRGLRSELVTGLFLGSACGVTLAVVALIWLGLPRVALCLMGGIGGGVAVSALLGLALPIALRMVSLDPKVAAGPIALAGADVLTLLLYFGLARWLLS
jgi:magnesium transporter